MSCPFVPLQAGFLVTRTDLYKCPLSAHNYRFLKWQFLGICVGKTDRLWNDVVITNLFSSSNTGSALSHSSVCLMQTHQASDISNTRLMWNGSLVGFRSCVWPATQPLLTHSSHPSWDLDTTLDPPVALISYFLGCFYIGETLKPRVKSSFCIFMTERLYLTTREWEQDGACVLLINVISMPLKHRQTNSLFTFCICNHFLLSVCGRSLRCFPFKPFCLFKLFSRKWLGSLSPGRVI